MTFKQRFRQVIHSERELELLLGTPSELVQNKVIHYIDKHCEDFIGKSPFVILSTSDNTGLCDASPRGDHPGFVKVIDKRCIVVPERP